MRTCRLILLLAIAIAPVSRAADHESRNEREARKQWLPDEMPLQLTVRRPQDLAYKEVAEREYLIFNLLANAKLAWDAGRYAEAAEQWESLLQVPDLDPRIDRVVRPLAIEARQKAGQAPVVSAAPPPPAAPATAPEEEEGKHRGRSKSGFDVTGTITGGGSGGPGGAVVWLKRADGKTPAPSADGDFVMRQSNKTFAPHVLAVPLGASVAFRNDDPIFHDVFSVSAPNDFDLGLYKSGLSRSQTFTHAGPVQLYCNIHAAMNAWVVVVDSPWFAVSDASGKFRIRNVPPGDYKVEVWHEASTHDATGSVSVSAATAPLTLAVGEDRRPLAYPPDKYGKPRQTQLGY
jgi:plastocyanin